MSHFLTNFVDQWLSGISDNTFCGALFVDFAKAFGVLDHDHLLRNVAVYELSPETRASVLTDRKQTVQVDVSTSDERSLRYGVSQGSILGPLLFSIYVSDLHLFI